MKKHKIIMGEWVSVYVNQTMIIETDKTAEELENMSASEIAELIETSDRCSIDICNSDYDWSTMEHEQWDKHDDCGYTYIEEIKGETDGNNGN